MNRLKYFMLIVAALFALFAACDHAQNNEMKDSEAVETTNPAAKGFNQEGSDPKAIAIADSVMQAMGGRKNWDDTKIIQWNFFGNRMHTWNKETGRDRIVMADSSMIIDFNIESKEGKVIKNGEEMTRADSVQKYINQGYEMWANDSYWLLMPYKMKDDGVTLKYVGIDTTEAGAPAYKLKLTFDKVGVTPENMYYVYVDTTDYMVRQWAYFPKSDMDAPRFILPWKDYKSYGNIKLSGNRGEYTISDISVMDRWPETEE